MAGLALGLVLFAAVAVAWSGHADGAGPHVAGGMMGRMSHRDAAGMQAHHAAMHGGSSGCTSCAEPSNETRPRVVMQDTQFEPNLIRIQAGTTVEWVNADPYAHTVTSDEGLFDSGLIPEGKAWTYAFTQPGTYAYHCAPHSAANEDGTWSGMTGTVVVTA